MEALEFSEADICSQLLNQSRHSSDTKIGGCTDCFIVEELLDFSNDEVALLDANGSSDCLNLSSADSSTLSLLDISNSSSFSGGDPPSFPADFAAAVQFSGDFCVASDDLAELEWLSKVAEESFSS